MPLFGKKGTVLLESSFPLGEFDIEADGAYRNVKTFPLDVKQGKKLFVSVTSSSPVDAAISNGDGICIKFKDSILDDTLEAAVIKKDVMTLVLGIFRGDKADVTVKAWTE